MRKNIENIDPIKITIPEELYSLFEQDAKNFEFYDYAAGKFVINKFLSALIVGYFPVYHRKIAGQYAEMKEILSASIKDDKELNAVISRLIRSRAMSESRTLERGKTRTVSIRPNSENDQTITEINRTMRETNETQAGFYRRMFDSYFTLPMYEREKLIYYKETEKIEKACAAQREIKIMVSKTDRVRDHIVIPYKIVQGKDERFNYLLAQEYNDYEARAKVVSFRLSRVSVLLETGSDERLDPLVLKHLKMTEAYSPQHSINDDNEILIELTKEGLTSYRSIYHNRPHCNSFDTTEDGKTIAHFCSSLDQLFFYFSRFNPGEAVILNSDELTNRLYVFHMKHAVNLGEQLGFIDDRESASQDKVNLLMMGMIKDLRDFVNKYPK